MSTFSVVPGSGTLSTQPLVTLGPTWAAAGEDSAGAMAATRAATVVAAATRRAVMVHLVDGWARTPTQRDGVTRVTTRVTTWLLGTVLSVREEPRRPVPVPASSHGGSGGAAGLRRGGARNPWSFLTRPRRVSPCPPAEAHSIRLSRRYEVQVTEGTQVGISTTVIPANGAGRSIAASAAPAASRPITSPTSRSGLSVPSATSSSISG